MKRQPPRPAYKGAGADCKGQSAIDSAGKLAGTSTTGCTYSGTIIPNTSPVAVLDVTIAENCAGTFKTLSGIATLNAAKTGLSVAYTTAAGAQGGVVVLQR